MRRLTALVVAVVATLLVATAASAQETGWTIQRFAVDIVVAGDGTLQVTEQIDVDFGDLSKHGIFRVVPVRYELAGDADESGLPADADPGHWLRVLEVSDIEVRSTAPDDIEITRPGRTGGDRDLSIRIGDPDVTVSGSHSYAISYRVRGAMNSFQTHEELYWNATGNGWGVPIRAVEVTVSGAPIVRDTCFQGPVRATRLCDSSSASGTSAVFRGQQLAPYSGLTVVVGFEPNSVDVAEPLLERRWTLAHAFVGSPWAVPLSVVVGLLGLAGVAWLAFREGRDRVTRGPMSAAGMIEDEPGRRSLLTPRAVPVRFRPPDELRPAQLGLVVDERVDPVDVSATIVDLAARGHLTIEEIEEDLVLWFSRTDWRLRRTEREVGEEVLGYEEELLTSLFEDGDEVLLSDLRGGFAEDFQRIRREVYADAVRRRWFNRSPEKERGRWLALGLLAVLAAVGLTWLLAVYSRLALVGLALLVPALVLVIAHRWMPHRTPRGSRILDETLGFKEFIVTAEADRMSFAEDERLFVSYLPYAVVFGAVDHWAKVLQDLGVGPSDIGWYVGAHPTRGFANLSSGLSSFAATVGPSLATTPASSGSSGFSSGGGFSGGGFGGGGGGSW